MTALASLKAFETSIKEQLKAAGVVHFDETGLLWVRQTGVRVRLGAHGDGSFVLFSEYHSTVSL